MSSFPPKKLAIYYGWPIAVNGTWTVAAAVNVFNDYDMVVFGAGLENPTHPEYATTTNIINQTTAKIYGYVDATLSKTTFEGKVNDWCNLGSNIEGIFCDRFGFDFGLTRAKQNDEVNFIHSKNRVAFVNAWNPDDVFQTLGGVATQMGPNDWYLAESYQIVNGVYQNPTDWKLKSNKMKNYRDNGPGFSKMATCTTYDWRAYEQSRWDYAYYSTVMCGFDAAGWGEENFSASSAQLPFRPRKNIPGTHLAGTIFANNDIFEIRTNVGIKIDTTNKTVSNLL